MNKVILIGRLGQDPEVKSFNGANVTNFSIATSKKYTDKNGQKHDDTTWHRISAWGKTGELCAQYLRKGNPVAIEGEVRINKKEDREYYSVVAERVEFLGSKNDNAGAAPAPSATQSQQGGAGFTEDDIPF